MGKAIFTLLVPVVILGAVWLAYKLGDWWDDRGASPSERLLNKAISDGLLSNKQAGQVIKTCVEAGDGSVERVRQEIDKVNAD